MTSRSALLEANAPWIALALLALLAGGMLLRRRRRRRRPRRRGAQPQAPREVRRHEPGEPGPDGGADGGGPD